MLTEVRRPALRWLGGKWKLAPWIISNMPQHRIYVEPFGGAMSVLLRKLPSYAEVYNDLDADVVNLFRVLRSTRAQELVEALRLTPFARDEFVASYEPCDDDVERARLLVIRSFFARSSSGHNSASATGFRCTSSRARQKQPSASPAEDFKNYPDSLPAIIERLRGVIIENRDAMEVMAQHDAPATLHYIDPPYVWSTREPARRKFGKNSPPDCGYVHELSDSDHKKLIAFLGGLKGMVMLSGYRSALYDGLLKDWQGLETGHHADGARDRVECLWLNEAATAALSARRLL